MLTKLVFGHIVLVEQPSDLAQVDFLIVVSVSVDVTAIQVSRFVIFDLFCPGKGFSHFISIFLFNILGCEGLPIGMLDARIFIVFLVDRFVI